MFLLAAAISQKFGVRGLGSLVWGPRFGVPGLAFILGLIWAVTGGAALCGAVIPVRLPSSLVPANCGHQVCAANSSIVARRAQIESTVHAKARHAKGPTLENVLRSFVGSSSSPSCVMRLSRFTLHLFVRLSLS